MSSTQGGLLLVLMGATAVAPWAALVLESRPVREKLARRKVRRTLRAAGLRATPGRTPGTGAPGSSVAVPVSARPGAVFVSVGAVVPLADEPPTLAA
ncbi:hypothetical protein ACL03H_16410 [Saccharopolyspora sp. MS10]|uniref:hypothetical protein n=1 Tax=Saccharopolyspora sp. MS10 TaxID=3385973 RepID=UPI0039A2460B